VAQDSRVIPKPRRGEESGVRYSWLAASPVQNAPSRCSVV